MIHKLVAIARTNRTPMKRTHPDIDGGDVEYLDDGKRVCLYPSFYIWKLPSLLRDCHLYKISEIYLSGRRPKCILGQVLPRSGGFFPYFGPHRRYFECYYGGTFPLSQ